MSSSHKPGVGGSSPPFDTTHKFPILRTFNKKYKTKNHLRIHGDIPWDILHSIFTTFLKSVKSPKDTHSCVATLLFQIIWHHLRYLFTKLFVVRMYFQMRDLMNNKGSQSH